jgi:CMP/dCMP kinase
VAAPRPEELVRVVALDGPAGSGKSTVSRRVAEAIGWRFVDTGATYRAVTLAVLRSGADLTDPVAVAEVASRCKVVLGTDPGAPAVTLDGEDVSTEIRGPEVTAHVSAVSAVPAVREVLIDLQRRAMGTEGSVVEGRDISTVVAPHAAVKVYLNASPEVRARRRAGDAHVGIAAVAATRSRREAAVHEDLTRRDALDNQTNRLEASDGAVHIDTDDLTVEQVIDRVVALVREAGLLDATSGMASRHV